MGIYNIMFIGGLILALIFLVLTVVLFFALKIPQALGSVTGQTQRKAQARSRRSRQPSREAI